MTKSISEKIFELRKARGFTQEKLGELCGISGQAVSKWEKGESLPDIMALPTLCEALGITADQLLEVPHAVREKNCMDGVFAYAKERGAWQAAYEAVCATSYASDRENGTAKMAKEGVLVHNTDGLALVISGEKMLKRIKETDVATIRMMMSLLADEDVMAVVRVLSFGSFLREDVIAEKAGLEQGRTEAVLFKLLKHGICECDIDGGYAFGAKSYVLFFMLAGFYIASPRGFEDIGNLTCSYTETE